MFMSIEVRLCAAHIAGMLGLLRRDADMLCAGMRLQGHDFEIAQNNLLQPGDVATAGIQRCRLAGTTTPWNTLCMWRLSLLMRTGFLMISDGVIEGLFLCC